MTHEHDASSDRSWQAFLYAQGEMSADEQAAFESQLENDTELCELVAEAVMLADMVAEASHQPMLAKPVRSERFAKAGLWTSALLGTCLVLAVAVGNALWSPSNSQDSQVAENAKSPAEQNDTDDKIIRLWVESEVETSPVSDADSFTGPVASTESEELNVPDWMFAALQYETAENVEEDSTPLDREEI